MTTSTRTVLPPLASWLRPAMCEVLTDLQVNAGLLAGFKISQGDGWWELDDLAREVVGAQVHWTATQNASPETRGLWVGLHGGWILVARSHIAGIIAALERADALDRLSVREMPDAINCDHARCGKRGRFPVRRSS